MVWPQTPGEGSTIPFDEAVTLPANGFNEAANVVAQAAFNEQKWVWVEDADEGYLAGQIISEDESQQIIEVALSNGKVKTVDINDTQLMNPPKFDQVEDAAQLTYLNEASVVQNLRLRYLHNKIYTYSGLFLVAVNPFQRLPMYSDTIVELYKNKRRRELPPHIFAAADQAYYDMTRNNENQSILITGESGAGKTESTKRVIQYLTAIASDKGIGRLEQQILQTNPILEAFGNAQTVRNKNSSRFGKFIRIGFSLGGKIAGAHIGYYLLEKSRVHHQSEKERNYHIFYQLLAANQELKERLLLDGKIKDYRYIQNASKVIEGIDDALELEATMNAMDTIGFDSKEQFDFFRIASSVLHIGNIPVNAGRMDQAEMNDFAAAERACHLLGIPVQDFCNGLLTPRIKAGRDWVSQVRNQAQVISSLEALAKVLYERSFGSLVERINQAIDDGRGFGNLGFIGVLDIAGFEIFEINSFEQLCINYTNEKLQQFFNHNMFTAEQEEYRKEGIEWSYIDFGLDLQPAIDLIEKANPVGILSCLDEECVMPKATDKTFTEKLGSIWSDKSSKYEQLRFKSGFILKHYAANVEYATDGWLDKNKDPLNENIARLLANSTEKYVASLFIDYSTEDVPRDPAAGSSTKYGVLKPRKGAGFLRTVGQRHKEQLNSLIRTLYDTQPHFIRCIVPNIEYKPAKFSVPLVLDQLRCNGVLEGIRIQRKGYPNRLSFADFRKKYEILCPGKITPGFMDGHKTAQIVLQAVQLDESAYKIGLSKVFFKADVMARLDEIRDHQLNKVITSFQARCRTQLKKKFCRRRGVQLEMVLKIQKNARIYVALNGWVWWRLYTKVKPLTSITRMDEELKEKNEAIDELQTKLQEKEMEYEKCITLNRSLDQEKLKLLDQLEAERQTAEDNAEIMSRAQEKLSVTLEELQKVTNELRICEADIESLKKTKEADEKVMQDLQSSIQEKEDFITSLNTLQTQHLQQISKLSQQMLDEESRMVSLTEKLNYLEEEYASHQALLQKKEAELKSTASELQNCESENHRLNQTILDNTSASQRKFEAMNEEYKAVTESVSTLEGQNAKFQTALHAKEAEVADLNGRLDEFTMQKERAERENQLLQSKLNMLSEELEIENVKKQQFIEEQTKYQEELAKLRELMEAKVDEETKQNELRHSREQELDALKQQQAIYEQEIQELRKKNMETITKLNEEKQQLRSEISMLEQEKNDYERSSKALILQLEEKGEAINAAETYKARTMDELKLKKSEIANLEVAISTSNEKIAMLEHKVTVEIAKNGDLESENQMLIASADTTKKQGQELKTEVNSLTNKLSKSDSANEALRQEVAELQAKLSTSDINRSKAEKQISVVNSEVDRLRAQHRQEVETLRKSLQDTMKVNQDDRSQLQMELERLQGRISQLEKANSRLTTEVEGTRLEAEREKSASKQTQMVLKHAEAQYEILKTQVGKEQQLREKSESIARQLQHSVDSLTAEIEEKRDQVASLQKRNDTVEQELKTYELKAGKGDQASTESKKKRRQLEHRVKELEEETLKLTESLRMADDSRKKLEQYGIDCRLQMEQEFTSKQNAWKDTKFLLMNEINTLGEKYDAAVKDCDQLKAANAKLSSELEDITHNHMEAKGSDRSKEIKRMEAEIIEWQHKAKTEEKARANYQEIAAIYENKAKELQCETENHELKFENAQKALKEVQKLMDELEQSHLADQEAIELLENKNNRLSEQVSNLQEDIERINDQHCADLVSRDTSSEGSIRRELWEELNGKNAKLEESKRALQAQLRHMQQSLDDYARDISNMEKQKQAFQAEVDDLRDQLDGASKSLAEELVARRKVDTELQELQILFSSEAAKATESSEVSILYKEKAESAMAKYEDAEIARLRLEKSESMLKNVQQELTESLRIEQLYREQACSKLVEMEAQVREMESNIDDLTIDKESLSNSQKRIHDELKMERERYAKEKSEWVQVEDATRRKYQRQLNNATSELEGQRETLKTLQAENREYSSTIEELTSRLQDEAVGSISWRREKEKMENRLAELIESLKILQEEREDIKEDLEAVMVKANETQNALIESENQRSELEQRCHMLQKRLIAEEDENQTVTQSKQLYERTIAGLSSEIEELNRRLDEGHDTQIEAKNKAQRAELLVIEAQNENSRLLELNEGLVQQKLSLEKQIQELQRCAVDDMRLATPSPRDVPLGYRIDELKAQLEMEAKSRVETTRMIRNNERVIESQKKSLKESEEQISRQQSELLASEQRVKSLRLELDDLFVSEAKTRSLQRSAEREAKEALERSARLERELERYRMRGLDRSVAASPSLPLLDKF